MTTVSPEEMNVVTVDPARGDDLVRVRVGGR